MSKINSAIAKPKASPLAKEFFFINIATINTMNQREKEKRPIIKVHANIKMLKKIQQQIDSTYFPTNHS